MGAALPYASVASVERSLPACSTVRVSGGDFNGAAGTILASVTVRNAGKRDCTIGGRPWIRLPRLAHPVTIEDVPRGFYLPDDGPGRVFTLHPGQRVRATIFIEPGACDRGRSVTFELQARVGWARRSVRISGLVCDNGTGTVAIGAFRRLLATG